jgi:hypothetical protein
MMIAADTLMSSEAAGFVSGTLASIESCRGNEKAALRTSMYLLGMHHARYAGKRKGGSPDIHVSAGDA